MRLGLSFLAGWRDSPRRSSPISHNTAHKRPLALHGGAAQAGDWWAVGVVSAGSLLAMLLLHLEVHRGVRESPLLHFYWLLAGAAAACGIVPAADASCTCC